MREITRRAFLAAAGAASALLVLLRTSGSRERAALSDATRHRNGRAYGSRVLIRHSARA